MFVRWMDGTCVETPEQRVGGEDEEPFIYNFYWDVQVNPIIVRIILKLEDPIRKAVTGVKKCAPLTAVRMRASYHWYHTRVIVSLRGPALTVKHCLTIQDTTIRIPGSSTCMMLISQPGPAI